MERYGDFFPENPQNLDELLEVMAQRMAAMQAMLNSMTPEQRAQLQGLAEQLLEDMDLRWQVDQLGAEPAAGCSRELGWDRQLRLLAARTRSASPRPPQLMHELGDLDQLENLLRGATKPGRAGRGRHRPGPRAARRRRGPQPRADGRAGQDARGGRPHRAAGRAATSSRPPGIRKIGQNALSDLFKKLAQDKMGQHELERTGVGHERAYETKPYEFGDPFNLDIERTVRNAIGRQGGGTPGAAHARRLRGRAHRAPRPLEHRADARPVAVDADARQLPRRQEGGDGAALAHLDASSRATTSASSASARWPASSSPSELPEVSWDFVYGTNMQHGFLLARRMLARQIGHEADHHDHRRRADRPHHRSRASRSSTTRRCRETIDATLPEVMRCTREGIRINTFMLDATPLPEELHREAHPDEPGPGLLHHPRDARRLRARRLHRAAAPALAGAPRVVTEPFDLEDTVVHVGLGSTLKPFGDWAWDQETLTRYAAEHRRRRRRGPDGDDGSAGGVVAHLGAPSGW